MPQCRHARSFGDTSHGPPLASHVVADRSRSNYFDLSPGIARQKQQRAPGFVKLVKWRTGSEARISRLKRDYGWARTRIDGSAGAQTWCGWGVLAHNATKINVLIAAADNPVHDDTGPPGAEPVAA